MIVLSGTHGTLSGESALSLQNERNVHQGFSFYVSDCQKVGIVSSLRPAISRMPYLPERIPDILKIRKLSPLPAGCFYLDPSLSEMTLQVTNIAYYYGREAKFLEDIKKFKPDVMMLAWCYSLNSDVSLLLRREGVFSVMIINQDLRLLTANPAAQLSELQAQIIREIGIWDLFLNCFTSKFLLKLRAVWRPACFSMEVRGLGKP